MPVIHGKGVLEALVILVAVLLSGCLAPISLQRSVLAYDHATTNVITEQLLLNIARAHHHHSIHFTGVSNIAATFDFRVNAGATPPLGGLEGGGDLSPVFGASIAENPTINIVPIEGEEFTNRLLTPFGENRFALLLREGVGIDLLLRLMAGQLRVPHERGEYVYHNRPYDREGYTMFRQAVLHLAALQARGLLYVQPIVYTKTYEIPVSSVAGQDFEALEEKYDVELDAGTQRYILKKRIVGRLVITNYDTENLSNEQRIALHVEANRWPPNDLLVDIRPEFPGGELSIHGNFRLRSFHAILNFLGRGILEELEFHVDKHPSTPPVPENPVRTIEILESETPPASVPSTVQYNGHYYYLGNGPMDRWNREAFRLLYQLFQMTVREVPRTQAPGITIAK